MFKWLAPVRVCGRRLWQKLFSTCEYLLIGVRLFVLRSRPLTLTNFNTNNLFYRRLVKLCVCVRARNIMITIIKYINRILILAYNCYIIVIVIIITRWSSNWTVELIPLQPFDLQGFFWIEFCSVQCTTAVKQVILLYHERPLKALITLLVL